jgi:hypothetical protein
MYCCWKRYLWRFKKLEIASKKKALWTKQAGSIWVYQHFHLWYFVVLLSYSSVSLLHTSYIRNMPSTHVNWNYCYHYYLTLNKLRINENRKYIYSHNLLIFITLLQNGTLLIERIWLFKLRNMGLITPVATI